MDATPELNIVDALQHMQATGAMDEAIDRIADVVAERLSADNKLQARCAKLSTTVTNLQDAIVFVLDSAIEAEYFGLHSEGREGVAQMLAPLKAALDESREVK